jgi:hypothetical protein
LGDINEVYANSVEELPYEFKKPLIEIDQDKMTVISTAAEYTCTSIAWLKRKYLLTFYFTDQTI